MLKIFRFGSRATRDASWVFLGQSLSAVLQLGYFVLLGRLLGSREYGIYSGAFALVSIVSQYAAIGSGVVFLRYVSPALSKFSVYWGNIIISILVSSALIVLGLHIWGRDAVGPLSAPLLVTVGIGDCLFRRLTECAAKVFQAMRQFRYTATVNMLTNVCRFIAVAILFLVVRHSTASVWAITSAAVAGVSAVVVVILISKNLGRPHYDIKLFFRHFWEGIGFSIASATGSVYNDIDKTILSHDGMVVANGIYTLAYRAADIVGMPISAAHSAMLPRFFTQGAEQGIAGTTKMAKRLLKRTSLLGALGGAAMFVCAPLIPLVLGESFRQSVAAVQWISLLPLCRSFHLSAGDALLAAGYQKVRFTMQVFAATGNLFANLYLIPRYSWRGAAWTTIGTDGMLGIVSWIVLLNLPAILKLLPWRKETAA